MTRIRVATAADAHRLGEIHDAAVRAFGPAAYDDEQIEAWTGDDGGDDAPTPQDDDHWIVAERHAAVANGDPSATDGTTTSCGDEGVVVGWGRIDVDAGEITGNYVHPDHARDGVGATIVAALEGYARGQGLTSVTLLASKNAIGFYETLGYASVADEVTDGADDEPALECRRLRKTL